MAALVMKIKKDVVEFIVGIFVVLMIMWGPLLIDKEVAEVIYRISLLLLLLLGGVLIYREGWVEVASLGRFRINMVLLLWLITIVAITWKSIYAGYDADEWDRWIF